MTPEEQELAHIEHQKSTWTSKIYRELEIWEAISMQINSTTGKNQQYWCRVMDLYNKKYQSL
jgi:hypothetical protein